MNFPCACKACGRENPVELSEIGQRIFCRGCGKPMVVSPPMEPSGPPVATPAFVKFRCPACNRNFATKVELAGKKIRCNGCGAGVRVPSPDDAGTTEHSQPTLKTFSAPNEAMTPPRPAGDRPAPVASMRSTVADPAEDVSPFLEELASIQGIEAPRHAGTVLPSRSEVMEQVRQEAVEKAVATLEKAEKKKKKKKRRKKSGYFDLTETLKLVAGVGALVVVLTLIAVGYPDFRFPLGGLLCVLGFVVYLLGVTSLRQHVAEEGPFKALLFRFCPPYQWWYVATRWDETRDFVAFFGAGMLILSLGGAIIKTSPIGKKAVAADQALAKRKGGALAEAPPPAPGVGRARSSARADVRPSPPAPEDRDDE